MNRSTPGLLSITNSWSSLRLTSIESVMPSSHLILCHPLLLLPPILPWKRPSIKVFSNESALHNRWPKYWSFSLSISPSNEHPGLISFKMDWLDLLAVQGTLKSLLQHQSYHFMANRWGNAAVSYFIFLGSKITADGDCDHEIKIHLLLGRQVMANLDSILKSRDITLP